MLQSMHSKERSPGKQVCNVADASHAGGTVHCVRQGHVAEAVLVRPHVMDFFTSPCVGNTMRLLEMQ